MGCALAACLVAVYSLAAPPAAADEVTVLFTSSPPGARLISPDGTTTAATLPYSMKFTVPAPWTTCVAVAGVRARWSDGSEIDVGRVDLCPEEGRQQYVRLAIPDQPTSSAVSLAVVCRDGAVTYKPLNGRCAGGASTQSARTAPAPPSRTTAAAPTTVQPEPAKAGMSTKKKIATAAAIADAIIGTAILASKLKGSEGGGGGGGYPALPPNGGVNGFGAGGLNGLGQRELLLFGGLNHDVFLGCLNCNEFDAGSVLNRFGRHGSEFLSESIFNSFGEYGSLYSNYSACNQDASEPPIIVDRQGNAYGRLTLNRFGYQIPAPEVIAWLAGVCHSLVQAPTSLFGATGSEWRDLIERRDSIP